METQKIHLVLEDGTIFTGESFGYVDETEGEVVFNTGMTGYENTLTDPSYRGQILVMTYPLVGNYGVPSETKDSQNLPIYFESDTIHIKALIVNNYSYNSSHWKKEKTLQDWLIENKIPALTGIDTRHLTQILREKGAMLGKIKFQPEFSSTETFHDPNLENLVAEVSCQEVKHYLAPDATKTIALIDCGVKNNTLRHFFNRKINVIRVPWDYDLSKLEFDGLMLSNGPGDPKMVKVTLKNIAYVLEKEIPTFGICMGNQLLSLTVGADTYKLKYGHRGVNQPCLQLATGKCYITSQNHGFAVDAKTLPTDWEVSWVNANDQTVEGVRHKTKPFYSVQFHPEACPGPQDTEFLFDEFINLL